MVDHAFKMYYFVIMLKELPRPLQLAGAALLGGQIQHAESILLHNGMVYNAILNHIRLHNWNRYYVLSANHQSRMHPHAVHAYNLFALFVSKSARPKSATQPPNY